MAAHVGAADAVSRVAQGIGVGRGTCRADLKIDWSVGSRGKTEQPTGYGTKGFALLRQSTLPERSPCAGPATTCKVDSNYQRKNLLLVH